ncbi:transposase, partial [Streptomyces sp. NPDC006476]|uniref:transposase n=1 Tax=Streptomyces sp. NPDC006476 TaxID=3157175 RepID=UPI0033A668FF
MTESEWQVIRAVLPVPAWLEGRGGRPEGYYHRQMIDAVRYVVDNGVKWANLPADFPPFKRVHAFARRWQIRGLLVEFHDRLRDRVRQKEGRLAVVGAAARASLAPKAVRPVLKRSVLEVAPFDLVPFRPGSAVNRGSGPWMRSNLLASGVAAGGNRCSA